MSPYIITSVTSRCRRNFVWFVLLLPRHRPPHLSCSINRSIHQTRHHDSWPSFTASDLLPCRRHPPQWHHHHQLSRWTWGVHGSTREVALFCFCLSYALLKITYYFIVMFTSWTPSQVQIKCSNLSSKLVVGHISRKQWIVSLSNLWFT